MTTSTVTTAVVDIANIEKMNTFGQNFRLTTFGESHGAAMGGVIDGMPAGIEVDYDLLRRDLARRRPGQSALTTARKEDDEVELLSGIYNGKTTGTPIGFIIRNTDQHSSDYEDLQDVFRPSHADFTYQMKYGIRDPRGGGRSSARETVSRIVGGAFAKMILRQQGIRITAYTSQVGDIQVVKPYTELSFDEIEKNPVRCADAEKAIEMQRLIEQVKADGDTIGGVVTCVIQGCPTGIGEPVFDKLQSRLAAAMLSINACKGFDYGAGFEGVTMKGSEQNDIFESLTKTKTNFSGGIQGGISNGQDIYFRCVFKPVATILKPQPTVNVHGEPVIVKPRGRHDPCVLPRAVPVVEAMAAMVMADRSKGF